MKNKIVTFIICISASIYSIGQTNFNDSEISLDYGYVRFTTLDLNGFHFQNSYKVPVNKTFSIKPSVSVAYASSKSVIAHPSKVHATYMTKDHVPPPLSFGWGLRANQFDNGFIKFNAHLDKSIYVTFDLKFSAGIYLKNSIFEGSIGPSLAYIDLSYFIADTGNGTFDGPIISPTTANIVLPLYHRFLDYGFAFDARYSYRFNKTFALGARINLNNYSEGERFLSSAISLSFFPK